MNGKERYINIKNIFAFDASGISPSGIPESSFLNRFTQRELSALSALCIQIAGKIFTINSDQEIDVEAPLLDSHKDLLKLTIKNEDEIEKINKCTSTQKAFKLIIEMAGEQIKNTIKKEQEDNLGQYISEQINDPDNYFPEAKRAEREQGLNNLFGRIFKSNLNVGALISRETINENIVIECGPAGKLEINIDEFKNDIDPVILKCFQDYCFEGGGIQPEQGNIPPTRNIPLSLGQIDDFIRRFLGHVVSSI